MSSAKSSKDSKYMQTLVVVAVAALAAAVGIILCIALSDIKQPPLFDKTTIDASTSTLLMLTIVQLVIIIGLWTDIAKIYRKLKEIDEERRSCNQA